MQRHVAATRRSIAEELSKVGIDLEARDRSIQGSGEVAIRQAAAAQTEQSLQPSGADR
jgi:hypothetical protein